MLSPRLRNALAVLAMLVFAPTLATGNASERETIKIWVLPGFYAYSVNAAIDEAKAKGLDVQVIEFGNWTTPNVALQAGDIDVDYFRHRPFLDNAAKARRYEFADAGVGVLANIGLYSLKHKSLAEIPQNGTVAIAGSVWQVFGQPRQAATRALLRPLDRVLPDDLMGRFSPEPSPGGPAEGIIALRFSGEREPDLADLAARCGGRLRLLDAALDRLAGHTQGRLLTALAVAPDGRVPDLSGIADDVEVLGYVDLDA